MLAGRSAFRQAAWHLRAREQGRRRPGTQRPQQVGTPGAPSWGATQIPPTPVPCGSAPRPMRPIPCSPPASTPGTPPCLRPRGEPRTESEIGKRGSRQSFLLRNSVAMPQGRWQEAAGPEHPNSTPKAAFTGIIISPSIFGLGVKGDLYAADRGSRRWRAVQPTCTLPLHQTHTLLHPFQGWKCQGQRRSRGRQP